MTSKQLGGTFKIEWITRKVLPFDQLVVADSCGDHIGNKLVAIGRYQDGTEIEVLLIFNRTGVFALSLGLVIIRKMNLIRRILRLWL